MVGAIAGEVVGKVSRAVTGEVTEAVMAGALTGEVMRAATGAVDKVVRWKSESARGVGMDVMAETEAEACAES